MIIIHKRRGFDKRFFKKMREKAKKFANKGKTRASSSAFPSLKERNQGFEIVKGVIVSENPFAMVDHTALLVSLQTIEQRLHAVALNEFGKAIGLAFLKQSLSTIRPASGATA